MRPLFVPQTAIALGTQLTQAKATSLDHGLRALTVVIA